MGKVSQWQDEYWLPLMQIYLQKPVGMKPMYSRKMVDLSLELHISPERLLNKMCQIANVETPRVEHFWEIYGNNPQKLARAVKLLREMKGFNNSEAFYDGVEVNESFERDFRPLAENSRFTPVMLILILDLYFRLTPQTMVAYLNRRDVSFDPLLIPCQEIWRRFGNSNVEALASYAEQLKEYFKN